MLALEKEVAQPWTSLSSLPPASVFTTKRVGSGCLYGLWQF